jgi:hypothetical protein
MPVHAIRADGVALSMNGPDGKPRPISLEHGLNHIQWTRSTEWLRKELAGQVQAVEQGKGWQEK